MKYEEEVLSLLKNTDDVHLVAGIAGEVGEVCSLFQKASYKSQPLNLEGLKEELGDVLFYTCAIATKYGFTLEQLMSSNIDKLKKRHKK